MLKLLNIAFDIKQIGYRFYAKGNNFFFNLVILVKKKS